MKQKRQKKRNPVAKFMGKFNRPKRLSNRKPTSSRVKEKQEWMKEERLIQFGQ